MESSAISEDSSLDEVRGLIEPVDMEAVAIPPDNRWSILYSHQRELISRLKGGSKTWIGRKGITTDLNGAYFVEVIGPGASPGLVKIRTKPDNGKRPVPLLDRDVDGALVLLLGVLI